METLNIVIAEILFCLALAWILGFFAAWILFRRVQKEYELELEELEENISYSTAINKNQEREITMQNLKIKELEDALDESKKNSMVDSDIEEEKEESVDSNESRDTITEDESKKILKLIEKNLYSPS